MTLATHIRSLPQHTLPFIPDSAKSNLQIKTCPIHARNYKACAPNLTLKIISAKLKTEIRTNQFQKPQGKPV